MAAASATMSAISGAGSWRPRAVAMTARETAARLQAWAKVRRQYALTDAHVQMARELGMKPDRLPRTESRTQGPAQRSLAQHIESLYRERFRKSRPDSVVPLRRALRDARAAERAEARERRRRKRQAELDHREAARVSMLTLRRMYGGVGANDGYGGKRPDG